MDDKNRARKAKEALDLIEKAFVMLDEAAYQNHTDSGDDLFWAVYNYQEAHDKACRQDWWNERNEQFPSPTRAIRLAIRAIEEG